MLGLDLGVVGGAALWVGQACGVFLLGYWAPTCHVQLGRLLIITVLNRVISKRLVVQHDGEVCIQA